MPPLLLDPNAAIISGPDSNDPFGNSLEINNDIAVAGAAPTTPKNLRVELVSNDWAEINWAPSQDDVDVTMYKINRSDGHVYTVGRDQRVNSQGSQDEVDKYYLTSSFIDCNYTRFSNQLHDCDLHGPQPGDVFSYTVTAVDNEGNESQPSNEVTVHYHEEEKTPVSRYADFYLDGDDYFAQCNDLSQVDYFLNEFDLMFSDEFNGNTIDPSKWNTRLTWGDSRIINGEQQYFVNTQTDNTIGYDPFQFTGNTLVIEAVQTPNEAIASLPAVCNEVDPVGAERCAFLSGALSSYDKFGFTYGYVEGRIKVSDTPGALSSFYLFHRYGGSGITKHAPEIDIVEYLGENPYGSENAFQTYHYNDVSHDVTRSSPTMEMSNDTGDLFADDFHTFGVLWEPQLVIWYIDGKEVKRVTGPQVSRQQMNIVTYLVAGSAWAPTPTTFPLRYELDYIRAYQRGSYKNNASFGE